VVQRRGKHVTVEVHLPINIAVPNNLLSIETAGMLPQNHASDNGTGHGSKKITVITKLDYFPVTKRYGTLELENCQSPNSN
jgi:hypothetical protein